MKIDGAVAALNKEREKLVHQLTELGATEDGELTGDVDYGDGFADAAAATAERSEVLGIVENLTKLLADVDQALVKVDEGTYGQVARRSVRREWSSAPPRGTASTASHAGPPKFFR